MNYQEQKLAAIEAARDALAAARAEMAETRKGNNSVAMIFAGNRANVAAIRLAALEK